MCITVQNKPAAFTEKQIIDVYKETASFKKFDNIHQDERYIRWEISVGFIYIQGYDSTSLNETVITRYVNDEEG